MSFNQTRRKRDPFGPRFGDLMGKHCHAALTAAARGKREEFDRLVQELYQMLDSIEMESVWPEAKPKAPVIEEPKTEEKKDGTTRVATEGKQVEARKGNKSPAKKRVRKASTRSDGYGDNN